MSLLSFISTDSITHAGCWWRHRSWEQDPAWYSWWRWDGPLGEASEPARLFPVTGTGQPTLHNLDTEKNDRIKTKWEQERQRMLTNVLYNQWTPTLKWRDKPADFLHAPLSRSCWEKVSSLYREATRSRAVRWRGAVLSSWAGVWGARGQWRRVVLLSFSVAGYILWTTGLWVTLWKRFEIQTQKPWIIPNIQSIRLDCFYFFPHCHQIPWKAQKLRMN